jgi:predicted DNA-binding transcriptional regulator AlpA
LNDQLDDPLLPTRQVAEYQGLKPDGLLAAVKRGDFPPPSIRSRRRCYWRRSVVLKAIAEAEAATAQREAVACAK